MARRLEGRTFNVSVIGLSGTEKEKGQYGVGKSCLCNRFINQVADGYYHEHISVLSQSDFAGRVINNNHFLYWGSVVKLDEGNNFTFQVVEQTEFIDDVSFSPFKTARTETYLKRATTKVTSAEKLMYICKDQLGMETDDAYPQVVMPDGKLVMDGFLCCFDVSKVPQRPIDKQVEFVAALLNSILKLKKPVVLATTKGDTSCPEYIKEVEKLLNRKEFKGSIPLVETSAHENINTEAAFMILAHLIDKTKLRTKVMPFAEARRQKHEILKVAKEAYLNLLRNTVSDAKALWNAYRKKLEPHSDFVHYVELFGSDQAKKEFRAHTKRLRDEHIRSKENRYLRTLPQLLKHYIPSLECLPERGWNTVRRVMREHPDFDHHFVMVEEEGCYSWKQVDSFLDDPDEIRIPFDLLNSTEAEMCFSDHLSDLQAHHRRMELQQEFKLLLEENPQVLPGKTLAETYVFFVGKECYSSLDEADRQHVYEVHMEELRTAARKDFLELLWEKSHVFWGWNTSAKLTHQDLQSITTALQDDTRYKALDHLEENRRVMILNHLGFIQSPSRERCGYTDLCIDTQVENLLGSMAIRPDLKDSSSNSIDSGCKNLNLVLLGMEGLAIALNKDIRNLCVDDEYQLDGNVYSLDYRPIDGDVSREQNALSTANFKPHGCLCVYNSEDTLDYIRESLERSLTNDVVSEGENTLVGMPIVILQASLLYSSPLYGHRHSSSHHQPPPPPPSSLSSSSSSQQQQPLSPMSQELADHLREKGKALAARLHGEFICCPSGLEEGLLFSHDQIHKSLQTVIHACNPGLNGWYLSDQFEPDIRLSMCLMCGDPFPLELPLGPLLNHEMCRVLADTPYCITLDLILQSSKQKVEIEVASYHGGTRLHEGVFHGHILVYSTKRKASLATLRAYNESLLKVPRLILAVSDPSSTPTPLCSSDSCQSLIQEGSQLADKMGAAFLTTTANFSQQTSVFLPFFRTVWDRREDSEMQYQDIMDEPAVGMPTYEERVYYGSRPPAPLPKTYTPASYHTHKSSTSNSTDSDPVYDQPINLFPSRYSDSDHECEDRGSSTSPPPSSSQLSGEGEELYSVATIPNGGERRVKPSVVKARRNVYAVAPPHQRLVSHPQPSHTKATCGSKLEHRKSLPIMPLLSTPSGSPSSYCGFLFDRKSTPTNTTTSPATAGNSPGPARVVMASSANTSPRTQVFPTGSGSLGSISTSMSSSTSGGNLLANFGLRRPPSGGTLLELSTTTPPRSPRSLKDHHHHHPSPKSFMGSGGRMMGGGGGGGRKVASEDAAEASDDETEEEEVEARTLTRKSAAGVSAAGRRPVDKKDKLRAKDVRGDTNNSRGSHHHHHHPDGLYSSTNEAIHDYHRHQYLPTSHSQNLSQHQEVTAPLAKPEAIEIVADYCHVKDAMPIGVSGDSDYQIVEDALPPGHLHRVMSVKPSPNIKESEDSDCSSLEMPEKHKWSKRSAPNRRKSKQRSHDKQSAIYSSPVGTGKLKNSKHGNEGRAHSPSEDNSEGTYDSGLPSSTKLERKRRSFNQRRWRYPSATLAHHRTSSPITNLDKLSISGPHVQSYDDMAFSPTPIHHFQTLPLHAGSVDHAGPGDEGDSEDLNDSSRSGKWLRSLRDTEKQRRKKDERRRQKEEEKKVKEAQKKMKKKETKISVTSTGSFALEEFPTAPENPAVPLFVYKCISYIELEGLQTEGLYRISGNKSQGEIFLSHFLEDPNTDINSLGISINAIATLLKNFFNDLTEPLISSSIRDELVEAAEMSDKSGRLLMLRGVIKKLPEQNYELLKYIITHLYTVAQNQEHNSMGSSNLARCWWPTLLRLEFKSYEKMMQGTQIPEDIVHALIEQTQFFFYGGNEV